MISTTQLENACSMARVAALACAPEGHAVAAEHVMSLAGQILVASAVFDVSSEVSVLNSKMSDISSSIDNYAAS